MQCLILWYYFVCVCYEATPSLLTDACARIGSPNVVVWNHWVAGLTGLAGQGVQAVANYV